MSESEALHQLYEVCKNMSLDKANEILINTNDKEEQGFISVVSDYFLQQRQKKVVAEKRF